MVLSDPAGVGGGIPAPHRAAAHHERGSQSLELAMVLPLVTLLLALLAHGALLGMDVVVAQGLAREAARAAAVQGEEPARRLVQGAAGTRPVRVAFSPAGRRPPGTLVTAEIEVRSRAFAPWSEVWIPARAAMQVERP